MKIYKTDNGIVVEKDYRYRHGLGFDWDAFINRNNLNATLAKEVMEWPIITEPIFNSFTVLAPIGQQEVWAAGVTYLRSRDARMEESKDSGGGSFYDKVYEAERPEIFFKSTAHRVVGQRGDVRIRRDSTWNVPEPELTLFINSSGKIEGYTIGNDMSSRSIEGENPLYLPQAKTYDGSASLGPCIYIPREPIPPNTYITIRITRKNYLIFEAGIPINRMKRKLDELAAFLFRECSFPHGCFLMTGTGIVPPNDFTLEKGDEITISIDHIGTLYNTVTL